MSATTAPAEGRVEDILSRLRELAPTLAENGRLSDQANADPTVNVEAVIEAGLHRLFVPEAFGGLWSGGQWATWPTKIRALLEVARGDGPTGQNVGTTGLVANEIFAPDNGLPDSTKEFFADALLHRGLRLVASNAEVGGNGPVVARSVPGGVVLSGTKSFNTNSGGGFTYANVGCVLDGVPGRHHVLVDLDDPQVEKRHDWNMMGQRGTYSQTIVYRDVFVADGWHYPPAATPDPLAFAGIILMHSLLMQGIGEGAYDATVAHVRTLKRGFLPQYASAAEDPLILRQLGEIASRLAASRALILSVAGEIEDGSHPARTAASAFKAKVAAVDASLMASSRIHDLTGARSAATSFGYDRFWRNARTFASHDPTDTKAAFAGAYDLTGQLPDKDQFLRV